MELSDRRSEARERALYLLYEAETKDLSPSQVLAQLALEPDALTATLVEGVEARRPEIDALIEERSEGWSLPRMPLIDLTIMRIGAFELLARADVPAPVILDEAVGMATMFSTDASGGFVNGVLAAIARDLGRL